MTIDATTLYLVITGQDYDNKAPFKLIENTIESSDPEDGGAEHKYVVQEIETGKFYAGSYSDWDIDYNTEFDDDENIIQTDLNTTLYEVYPKVITKTIYSTVK